MEEKECTKCHKLLPLTRFEYRSDTKKLRGACRTCHKGYTLNVAERHIEIMNLLEKGRKVCGRCLEEKDISEFGKDNVTITKHTSFCKSCISKKGFKARGNPETNFFIIKSRYKTTDEAVADYVSKDKCEICGNEFGYREKHFDHSHSTGLYRGTLCKNCNIGIGCFLDNSELLIAASKYIQNSERLSA